jgi:hypothetical protein
MVTEDEIQRIPVPIVFNLIFILAVNTLVILASRSNKLIGSHKKHLLQLLMIFQITFYLGSPKLASYRGVLGLIAILQLTLYSEFNVVALIFEVAIHMTYMDNFIADGHTVQYFVVYFIHFWIVSYVLR